MNAANKQALTDLQRKDATMRAMVLDSANVPFRLADAARPEPGFGEVLVRTKPVA